MPRNSDGRAWNASESLDCASVAYFSRTSDTTGKFLRFITVSARISVFFGLREVYHVRPQRTPFSSFRIYIRNSFCYSRLFITSDIHARHSLHLRYVLVFGEPPTCVKPNDIVASHLYNS